MAALGSLVVKLGLDFAQYTGGLDKSEQAALAASKRIQDTFDGMASKIGGTIGAIAGGIAAGFTVAAFKNIITGTIEAGAALDDLSMKTGETVENLSGLASISKFSGLSAEDLGGSMNKLAKNLAGASEEGKGTAAALRALGIDFDSFKKLSPAEQMQTVAKAMNGFKDSSDKSAAAMAIYGKQGAALLPFFKDLATAGDLQAKMTTEQAAASANFDDNLVRLKASGEGWKKELALGIIPALDKGLEAFLNTGKSAGGLKARIHELNTSGDLQHWAEQQIQNLSYVADAGDVVVRSVIGMAKAFGATVAVFNTGIFAIANAFKALVTGNFNDIWGSFASAGVQIGSIIGDVVTDIKGLTDKPLIGENFRQSMGEITAKQDEIKKKGPDAQKALDFKDVLEKDKNAAAAAKDSFSALIEAIKAKDKLQVNSAKERVAEINSLNKRGMISEIETIDQVSEAEIESLEKTKKALQEERALYAGQSNSKKDLARLDGAIAEQEQKIGARSNQLRRESAEYLAKYNAELDKSYDSRVKSTHDLEKTLKDLQDEGAAIGLNAESVRALEIARANERAEALERAAVTKAIIDGNDAEASEMRKQAQLIREIAAQKGSNAIATEISGDWKAFTEQLYSSLTDSLYRGFEQGKGFFKSFWDSIRNTIKSSILKFGVQAVVSVVGGGIKGAAASVLSDVGGASNAFSTASNAYSLGSAAYTVGGQVLGGTMSVANAAGTLAANATGTGISGLLATNGAYGTAAAGSAASTAASIGSAVVTAAPYLLAAFVALNALGVFRSEKQTDVGIKGTVGQESNVSGFTTIRKGGTLFSGPSYRDELSALPEATQKAINGSVKSMYDSVGGFAKALGLNADSIKGYTKDIFISTKDLTDEQIQAKLEAVFKGLGDDLANIVTGSVVPAIVSTEEAAASAAAAVVTDLTGNVVPALDTLAGSASAATSSTIATSSVLKKYAKDGESAFDTLGRLANSLAGVNAVFDTLNTKLFDASIAGAAAASSLVDVFGGMEKFQQATAAYMEGFYTPAERVATTTRQLGTEFDKLGLVLPKTRAAYRELVETYSQKLDTEEGRKMYAALVQFAPIFASITQEAEASTAAADKSFEYQQKIRRLQGEDRVALDADRAKEYAAAQALGSEVAELAVKMWTLEDAAAATAKATERAAKVNSVQDQIDQLNGNERAIVDRRRAAEYAAASGDKAMQDLINSLWVLEDAASATAAAATAAAEAEAKRKEIEDTNYDLEQKILRATGRDREALDRERGKEWARLNQLSPATAALAVTLWEAEDAANAAAAAVAARNKEADDAYALVQRSVEARKATLTEIQAIQQVAVNGFTAVATTIKNSIKELLGETTGAAMVSAEAGRRYIQNALATGLISSNDDLNAAIAGVRGGMSESNYASRADYDFARFVLADQLKSLGVDNDEQLTTAERMLKNTQEQLAWLDKISADAKKLIDTMKGVDTSVVSVEEAIALLTSKMFPSKPSTGGSGTSSSPGGAVVGAGPSAGGPGSSYMGRQSDGSYAGFDGYMFYSVNASRAAGLNSVASPYVNTNDLAGYYAAAKAAGYSLKEIAAFHGANYADALRDAQAAGIPAFAGGGLHSGGLRVVGERGWELEATGSSRIWNQAQLGAALRSPAANDSSTSSDETKKAIEANKKVLEDIRNNTKDTANFIRNATGNGQGYILTKAAA